MPVPTESTPRAHNVEVLNLIECISRVDNVLFPGKHKVHLVIQAQQGPAQIPITRFVNALCTTLSKFLTVVAYASLVCQTSIYGYKEQVRNVQLDFPKPTGL